MSSIIKVNTFQDANGNALFSSDGSGTVTLDSNFSSAIPSGGDNTPAFEVKLNASQNISNNTLTKAQFDTVLLDTDTCFDNTTNYRFTPTTTGKYYIYGAVSATTNASENNFVIAQLYKNGSLYTGRESFMDTRFQKGQTYTVNVSAIVDMNGSTDFVELYGRTFGGGGSLFRLDQQRTYFGGYKLIGA